MNGTADISVSLRVATMSPLDAKSIFQTILEMKDLGNDYEYPFTYYNGMESLCLENDTKYIWKEIGFGEVGLIPGGFTYPPNTIVNDIDYSSKVFNFIPSSNESGSSNEDLFYIEPSVNIQIAEEPISIDEAFFFGTADIGAGVQDVALVKNSFVSQSGYNIHDNQNIGDEIKLSNATNSTYLGHFKITSQSWNGYKILTIIEKGIWDILTTFPIQKVVINLLRETNYNISLSGTSIQLFRGASLVGSADISALLPASTATIVSGVLNPSNGIVTFTLSDATSFTVDFSGLINAEDYLTRTGNIAVKGNDIYQNLFVTKGMHGFLGTGFYSADTTTNYNSGNFPGFPYPSGRKFIVLKYNSLFYMLVKKDISPGARLFSDPNTVLGMSFYKYRTTAGKSMQKIAYVKVLTRKTLLTGLNPQWWAFPIWHQAGNQMPNADNASTPFSESYLPQVNESQAICFVSKVYEETLSLKKEITLPYTLKEEDNGFVLHLISAGTLTVPELTYGFECGLIQRTNGEVAITETGTASIAKPSGKDAIILGSGYSAYLMSDEEYNHVGTLPLESTTFLLSGDLKDS